MADACPFRGLRYNTHVVGNLASVLSPPFDTISPTLQRDLYQRSPYNVVRLEAGEQLDSDTSADNRYTRARELLSLWKTREVLIRDPQPAFYLLRHEFTYGGRVLSRHGLVACVRLEDYDRRVVLPHEFTGERDKQDRLALMEACQANFSPIMCLYQDRGKHLASIFEAVFHEAPMASVSNADGQDYALWRIDSSAEVRAIRGALASEPIYIADGHHRYETALRYRDLHRAASAKPPAGEPAFDFALMTLIEFQDPGLMVLPYHRVLGPLDQDTIRRVEESLKEWFEVAPAEGDSSLESLLDEVERKGRDGQVVGLLGPQGSGPLILRLKPRDDLTSEGPIGESEPWLLEEQILKPLLGNSLEGHIAYVHDAGEAEELARSEQGYIAFFLKPFPLDLFRAIVDTGQKLPRKSTFFYPKLPTGVIINSLEGTL